MSTDKKAGQQRPHDAAHTPGKENIRRRQKPARRRQEAGGSRKGPASRGQRVISAERQKLVGRRRNVQRPDDLPSERWRSHPWHRRKARRQPCYRNRIPRPSPSPSPRSWRLRHQAPLAYDSGSGNGPFGFGWTYRSARPSLARPTRDSPLRRQRRVRRLHPLRRRGSRPRPRSDGERLRRQRTLHGVRYDVAMYRPRIEGLFARIERWIALATGVSHWRTITRDNVTTLYGFDTDSRIADPGRPRRIFSLPLCRQLRRQGQPHALRLRRRQRHRGQT